MAGVLPGSVVTLDKWLMMSKMAPRVGNALVPCSRWRGERLPCGGEGLRRSDEAREREP
jgi:hypothetical protein